jgi:hypothetical protein
MRELNEAKVFNRADVDGACQMVVDALNEANESVLGLKRLVKGKSTPWYTPEIRVHAQERTSLFQEYKQDPTTHKWKAYRAKRQTVNNLVRTSKKNTWNDFVDNWETNRTANPKKYWNTAKRLLKRTSKRSSMPIRNDAGTLVTEPDKILEAFAEHYAKLGKPSSDAAFDDIWHDLVNASVDAEIENPLPQPRESTSVLNDDFTSSEMLQGVRQIKNGVGGCDKIRPQMLKAAAGIGAYVVEKAEAANTHFIRALTDLACMALRCGKMPEVWAKGQIFNIFKKGDPADRGNYRGITLLSVIGKLVTRAMADRLQRVAEKEGWIADEQGGFRKDRRTEDQALILLRAIESRRLTGKDTCVVFVDLAKAYDRVFRRGLVYKLMKLGIHGKMLHLLNSMYSSTSSTVLGAGGGESRLFAISEGVRQGDPLSCILFNLFINDLVEKIAECGTGVTLNKETLRALLFADDIAIPCASTQQMEKVLQALEQHSALWRWKANTSKTKLVMFPGRGKKQTDKGKPVLKMYGAPLGWVEEYEYLGLTFASDLSWGSHIAGVIEKAKRRAGEWKQLFTLRRLSRSSRIGFYQSMIRPLLEFACSVWTPNSKQAESLEAVQLMCLRWVIPCAMSTPASAIRCELGVASLSTRRMQIELRYWFDIRAKYDRSRLVYKAGTWKINNKTTGAVPAGHNRILAVETFEKLGLDRKVWNDRAGQVRSEMVSEKDEDERAKIFQDAKQVFVDLVDERASDFELKLCKSELSGNTSYLELISGKEVVSSEEYLKGHTYGACLQFRLRTNTLGLGVKFEKGKRVSSACPMCGEEKESVCHFLAECKSLCGQREALRASIPNLSSIPKDFIDEILGVQEGGGDVLSRVHQFFTECWSMRGEAMGIPRGTARFTKKRVAGGRQPSVADFFAKDKQDNRDMKKVGHGGLTLSGVSSHSSVNTDGANGSINAMA